jgi:hypothetical protein
MVLVKRSLQTYWEGVISLAFNHAARGDPFIIHGRPLGTHLSDDFYEQSRYLRSRLLYVLKHRHISVPFISANPVRDCYQ